MNWARMATIGMCLAPVVAGSLVSCAGSPADGGAALPLGDAAPSVADVLADVGSDGDLPGTVEADAAPRACSTDQECAERLGDLEPCERAVCDLATGDCAPELEPDPSFCCTLPAHCDDGDPCTQDTCQVNACVHAWDPACCKEDADCGEAGACSAPVCLSDGSCSVEPRPGPCDDGLPCTSGDTCVGGVCQGVGYSCSVCEHCDGTGACELDPGFCRIEETCFVDGASHPTDPCTACDVASPLEWSPVDGGTCDDGDPCTEGDACVGGLCAGTPMSCAELDDVCHDAACVEGACEVVPKDSCDDGSACTVGDGCVEGVCTAGEPVVCDDGDQCTADWCEAQGGCQHTEVPVPCDDGDACTANDTCDDGACGGQAIECDDQSSCTLDLCDPGVGCVFQSYGCCGTLGVVCPEGFECQPGGTCESPAESFIPEGGFWMGRQTYKNKYGFELKELPVHPVMLSAYAIDKTEVTNGAYAACHLAGACTAAPAPNTPKPNVPGYDQYPVANVTWNQAAAYCAWAGKRLPTEAEWERAAGGGCEVIEGDCLKDRPVYPWGDDYPTCENADIMPACNGQGPSKAGTSPGDRSAYGVMDMGGNLREWVADWFKADYYCNGPEEVCPLCTGCGSSFDFPPYQVPWWDPKGAPSGTARVVRGTAWNGLGEKGAVADRQSLDPETSHWTIGFRCARSGVVQ